MTRRPITLAEIEAGMAKLSHFMAAWGDDAPKLIPLYERLAREAEALREKGQTVAEIIRRHQSDA
jgi:hypothetical protein